MWNKALLYLTSVFSYNLDFTSGATRPCKILNFIRREGLSLAIWFDIVESAFGENIHMTINIFANVHQLMFLVLKLVWIRIEYSLV